MNSAVIDSVNRQISELEWRINVTAEDKDENIEVPIDEIKDGDEVKY